MSGLIFPLLFVCKYLKQGQKKKEKTKKKNDDDVDPHQQRSLLDIKNKYYGLPLLFNGGVITSCVSVTL